ncbi:MAG: flagellar assembly peptidoglycan hydrolase FlgJ [Gammaproteobacteria bacterium]
MDDKITYNTRIYSDVQSLKQLHYSQDSVETKKEVSRQFEAILMQMVMHSMRDANKGFASSGLFGSDQMDMYQDMFDKQLTMSLSNSNLGFAKMVEDNIDQVQHSNAQGLTNTSGTHLISQEPLQPLDKSLLPTTEEPLHSEKQPEQSSFASAEDFIKKLWPSAKVAASLIGASPEILLAQAALETNWGKNVLPEARGNSTHNLFNIKADSAWGDKVVRVDSLEQKNGILVKEKSNFRSYDSFDESFMDYVSLLKQNDRYGSALNKAPDPGQFMHALQDAGYATDQNYANKIMKIYSSHNFQDLVTKVKQTA